MLFKVCLDFCVAVTIVVLEKISKVVSAVARLYFTLVQGLYKIILFILIFWNMQQVQKLVRLELHFTTILFVKWTLAYYI